MPLNSSWVGADSTIRPAYITLIRLVRPATTPMSWVTSSVAIPSRSREVVEQRQDLRLDRHVERGRRLVGEQHLRLAGQRDRDHHPLPQTTGQLVRIVPQTLLRTRQPDQLQHLERPLERLLLGGLAVQADRLGDLLADRLRRVQRRLAVLEDHRHLVAAHPAQLGFSQPDEFASRRP